MTWRAAVSAASAVASTGLTLVPVNAWHWREHRHGANSVPYHHYSLSCVNVFEWGWGCWQVGREDGGDCIAYMIYVDHHTQIHTDTHTLKGNGQHGQ